ncbi:MAG: hypothetical protein ABIQ12_14585 [Opitutaceae bacterium]
MSRNYLGGAAGFGIVAAFFLGGCASSQMSRIDRNRDIYETWPLETKQAVLDGLVEPGMNADMVRVSWGEPSEIATSPAGDEIWVFKKGGSDGSVYYPGGGMGTTGMGGTGIGSSGIGGSGIGIGSSGPGIGISTGRGGTSIGATGGIGIGGSIGGSGIGIGSGVGGGGMGGMGGPIVTQPTPPDIREVVFRGGVVVRADKP